MDAGLEAPAAAKRVAGACESDGHGARVCGSHRLIVRMITVMASSRGTRSCARICARDSRKRGVTAETTGLVRDKPHHVCPGESQFERPGEIPGTCFTLLITQRWGLYESSGRTLTAKCGMCQTPPPLARPLHCTAPKHRTRPSPRKTPSPRDNQDLRIIRITRTSG
jgi:hypothetical protein